MEDKKESKVELEREYVINLRRDLLKVATYKKAKKAIRAIKEFLAKHMKVENRDMRKVKIDRYLNEEMWFRGIAHPHSRIKVKAKKIDGIVYAELADVPKIVQYRIDREKKIRAEAEKSAVKNVSEKPVEEKTEEQKTEEKEKEQATAEAEQKEQKFEAKQEKHTVRDKPANQNRVRRQVMQK